MHIRSIIDLSYTARKRRKSLGMNQLELAEKIGSSRSWVINFEKGKTTVELELVLRVIQALDLAIYIEPTPLVLNDDDSDLIDLDEIIGTTAGSEGKFRPDVLLGRTYQRVDFDPKEYIRFRDGASFLFNGSGSRWKTLSYVATDDGILLNWGAGDEFSAQVQRGGKEIIEHRLDGIVIWQQTSEVSYLTRSQR